MRKFKFHYDAGHGWLQVHLNDLQDIGLAPADFTRFSYRNGDWLYLEEDLDAGTFIREWERKFDEFRVHHIDDGYNSPIRNFERLPDSTSLTDEITF